MSCGFIFFTGIFQSSFLIKHAIEIVLQCIAIFSDLQFNKCKPVNVLHQNCLIYNKAMQSATQRMLNNGTAAGYKRIKTTQR